MKLPQNSLFAILLRARWWVSALVGLAVFAVVRLFLDAGFGFFAALPFLVIANVVLWRELRAPRGARLEEALTRLRALPWEEFAAGLAAGYRREGYEVARTSGAADLRLEKAGALTLVAAKRWKASRTGVEPLKALAEARARSEAQACLYVCAAELTGNARQFATQAGIGLVEGAELVKLLEP